MPVGREREVKPDLALAGNGQNQMQFQETEDQRPSWYTDSQLQRHSWAPNLCAKSTAVQDHSLPAILLDLLLQFNENQERFFVLSKPGSTEQLAQVRHFN